MIEETEMMLRPKRQTSCPLGRPPVPLFTLSNRGDVLVALLRRFCETYYHADLEKFVFEKSGVGKGRVWAFVYVWLVEQGFIVNDDNVESYHAFISENLDERYVVVREVIGRNLKPIRPFITQMTLLRSKEDVGRLKYSNTTLKSFRQYVVLKQCLNALQEK